jgi:redox-sensitive bicupin YhaK (pirin superfamily)
MHGREFTRRGGTFEVVQLWVNLPAKDKGAKPGYQSITASQIPQVELPGGSGTVRVIAGEFHGANGPARTFTALDVWDLRVQATRRVELPLREGRTSALFVLKGQIRLAGGESAANAELAIFSREGKGVAFDAETDATLLVLAGEPIDEPIVGAGPFVMNTQEEIAQAYADYRSGKMGTVPAE